MKEFKIKFTELIEIKREITVPVSDEITPREFLKSLKLDRSKYEHIECEDVTGEKDI